MRTFIGWRSAVVVLAVAVLALVAACSQATPARPQPQQVPPSVPVTPTAAATAPPVGPHGGIDLNVLVVTDGTAAVQAIGQQLTTEGVPSTVINLKSSSRPVITRNLLARSLPGGSEGGNFEGIVLPDANPSPCRANTPSKAGGLTGNRQRRL